MHIVIEKRSEVKKLGKIKEIYPNIKVVNTICEFKPTIEGLIDPICDYCQHGYFSKYVERCRIRDEKL